MINDADRLEFLRDAKRRGLNLYEYARLPGVPVAESTLYRWQRQLGHLLEEEEEGEVLEQQEKPTEEATGTGAGAGEVAGALPVAGGDPVTTFISEARENHVPEALKRSQKEASHAVPVASDEAGGAGGRSKWAKVFLGALGVVVAVVGVFGVVGSVRRGRGTVNTQKTIGEVVNHANTGAGTQPITYSRSGAGGGVPEFRQTW